MVRADVGAETGVIHRNLHGGINRVLERDPRRAVHLVDIADALFGTYPAVLAGPVGIDDNILRHRCSLARLRRLHAKEHLAQALQWLSRLPKNEGGLATCKSSQRRSLLYCTFYVSWVIVLKLWLQGTAPDS